MSNKGITAQDDASENADDAEALYVLGTRYSIGRDVEQDLIAAHKWFNLAAMMGHEEARQGRAELAREMSAADVAEAQRQARAWLWSRAQSKSTANASTDAQAKPATPIKREEKAFVAKPSVADHAAWRAKRSLCA